jgi:hypothetical protein
MIKPRELRIGNWLQLNFASVKVTEITENGFKVEGDKVFPQNEEYGHIEPIPLTLYIVRNKNYFIKMVL